MATICHQLSTGDDNCPGIRLLLLLLSLQLHLPPEDTSGPLHSVVLLLHPGESSRVVGNVPREEEVGLAVAARLRGGVVHSHLPLVHLQHQLVQLCA
jgi:hypothetical protein